MKLLRVTKKIVYFITDLCLVNVTLSPLFLGEIFKITWREFANLLFKLAEKFLQHSADGLGKQRIGLLADPDDIGTPAVDEVGVD